MAKETSFLTDAGEKAGQMLFDLNKEIQKVSPIPFGKVKVSSSDIRREIEGHMTKGTWNPVTVLDLVQRHGYSEVNNIVGKIVTQRGQ